MLNKQRDSGLPVEFVSKFEMVSLICVSTTLLRSALYCFMPEIRDNRPHPTIHLDNFMPEITFVQSLLLSLITGNSNTAMRYDIVI
jgi:hypothetical protein